MNFSGELTDAHKEEMRKHGGFSQDKIVDHYNELAPNYEQIYLRAGWHDPQKCAELAAEFLSGQQETATILDMGCGTGLVG
jgi:predicted TPR repeat methyltransferase